MGKEENMLILTGKLNDRRNMVNESSITNIEDYGNYSTIYFIGGGELTVKESWSDIQASLNSIATTTATSSETSTVINTNNAPASGRVLIDLKSLMDEAFKYDTDTERDVKLVGDSIYLICSKYGSAKFRMASNIRENKPVFEGCESDGWVYYTRISAGQIVESDGISVPPSKDQKIREVLNNLLEKYK